MKKVFVLAVLGQIIFNLGGINGLYAHDRGDLMLNIEPFYGFSFPNIEIKDSLGNPIFDGYSNTFTDKFGMDIGLNTTVHYYFIDYFGVNLGFGLKLFMTIWDSNYVKDSEKVSVTSVSAGYYATVPVGVRFSYNGFALGLGVITNIPLIDTGSVYITSDNYWYNSTTEDYRFNTHVNWYTDIGFDLSGRKDRTGGFGLLTRLQGNINQVAKRDNMWSNYHFDKFNYFSFALIFQAAIMLDNIQFGANSQL